MGHTWDKLAFLLVQFKALHCKAVIARILRHPRMQGCINPTSPLHLSQL